MSKQTPEQRAEEIFNELADIYTELNKEAKTLGYDDGLIPDKRLVDLSLSDWADAIEHSGKAIKNLRIVIAQRQPEALSKRIEWIATTMQLKCRNP